MTGRVPVHVLTGFLGSGKTTLLRHVLRSPDFADCAVLVNEFGEIGLDHHLIADVRGDVLLMQSGCVCCTIRGDLAQAIRGLHARRERGEVAFARLVVETTGLADPTPILGTVLHDPQIRHHFRLGSVLATVDAVNGAVHLDRQPESVKQAALADRIVITKTDLAAPAATRALAVRLHRLNPAAQHYYSANAPPPAALLLAEPQAGESAHVAASAGRLVAERVAAPNGGSSHDARIQSFTMRASIGTCSPSGSRCCCTRTGPTCCG